jgi:hypothetical protein
MRHQSLFSPILLLIPLFLQGQAVTKTREALDYFEKSGVAISKKCIRALAEINIHPESSKSWHQLSNIRQDLHHQKEHFHKKEVSSNELVLRTEFSRFLSEAEAILVQYSEWKEAWITDSLSVLRQRLLKDVNSLTIASLRLEQEVAIFCIENRLTKPEDGSRIGKFFREGQQRFNYLNSIQDILLSVADREKHCLNNFIPDSLASAEKRRLEFAELTSAHNLKLKSLPGCCGDRQVKAAALNSLRLFAIEAKNELLHLEKFIQDEEEFIQHHQKTKEKQPESQAEKEAYRNAVRKYNADIKAANELVRNLEKNREEHLSAYRIAQLDLFENWLTTFPE